MFVLKYEYHIDTPLPWGALTFIVDDRGAGTVKGGTRTSDPTGNFDDIVDLYSDTPVFQYQVIDQSHPGPGLSGVIKGPLKGERVVLRAEYNANSLGWISSNPLTFTWTKDNVPG